MAQRYITGIKELDRELKGLADRDAAKIGRRAINDGMKVIQTSIQQQAPVGPTGNLKKSIGKRQKRKRKENVVSAVIGVYVGKKLGKRKGNHAHLIAAGTASRFTRKGAARGSVTPDNFVERGAKMAQPAATAAIINRARKEVKAL